MLNVSMNSDIMLKNGRQILTLGMYWSPAMLDNPATFCQIRQFPESGNENPSKNARKQSKMWPKYEFQAVIYQKFSP